MPSPYWQIISGCWVAFWVYWSLSAGTINAPKRQVPLSFTILNTALLYVGFVLVLIGRANFGPLALRLPSGAAAIDVVGTLLVVAGVALAIWSRRVLGTNWSSAVRISEGQRLVRTGPYAVVRNPIYSGMVLAIFGTALVAGTLGALLGFALVVASLWRKGRMEERFLLAEFGEEYAAYQRNVKFLIPLIV
jgi:protein-S-isoprenylcysteine O-methyltransferase Ste14